MVSSPSTRTTFATIAMGQLPDLHLVDPAGRMFVRRSGAKGRMPT